LLDSLLQEMRMIKVSKISFGRREFRRILFKDNG